jgi:hypothetical protein
VGAGGGDFESPLGGRLAADVREVGRIRSWLCHKGVQIDDGRRDRAAAEQVGAGFDQRSGTPNFQALNDPGFGQIVRRQ